MFSFAVYASGIPLPDCSKLAINRETDNGATIYRHDVIVKLFWRCFVSLVKFSYWSKFYVNIITGSGVFFYKGLTRNLEIGITPICVLPNIWSLKQVRDTKFDTNVSNKILLNAAKCQGYSFYRFWVIMGKKTGQNGQNSQYEWETSSDKGCLVVSGPKLVLGQSNEW